MPSPLQKAQTIAARIVKYLYRHWRGLTVIACILLLCVLGGIFIVQALNTSLSFNGYALDGAFQLFNPLHRMAQGAVAGADFQFFHGIGVPLLHFPFFWLMGHDLFASEMVRWTLSPALFFISTGVLFWVLTKKWWGTLLGTFITTCLALGWVAGVVYPENSLLGLRSVGPVFVLAALLARQHLQAKRIWRLTAYQLLLPFALAVSLICGTEQGLGALAAFTLIELCVHIKKPIKVQLQNIGILLGVYAAWLLAILTVITLGHPIEPLYYIFGQVGVDQFWYFGTSPNDFLQHGRLETQLTHPFMLQIYVVTALAVGLLIMFRHRAWIQNKLPALWFGVLAGAITGCLAAMGYWAPQVFIPHARLLLLTIICVCALWLIHAVKSGEFKKQQMQWGVGALFILLVGWSLNFTIDIVNNLNYAIPVKDLAKKAYHKLVTQTDTETVGVGWQGSMRALIPIINSDNAVAVIESGADGYTHGINPSKNTVLVAKDKFAQLLYKGQIIYLPDSGRHRIASTVPDGKFLAVTLETATPITYADGYPAAMTISERLDKSSTRVWSTYTALEEAEMQVFAPNHGYDYIIHALGPARDQYFKDFEATKPDFVITTHPQYSYYVEWLEQRAWPLYGRLLKNYHLVAMTGSHLLWQKNDGQTWEQLDTTSNSQDLTIKDDSIALPANDTDKQQIILVTVDYKIDGWLTHLPALQRLPRYALTVHGTASITDIALPPHETSRTFPIALAPHQKEARLDVRAFSLVGGADLDVFKAIYQLQQLSDENYQGFTGTAGPIKP